MVYTDPYFQNFNWAKEEKNNNFVDSMFHVSIENTKNLNYFTEKIKDFDTFPKID